MLKKKIGLIAITSLILLGCSSTNEKKDSKNKVTSNKKEISVKKSKNFEIENNSDFRNASWGMSIKDIMKLEIDKDIFDIPDLNGIGFYEEVLGINALVVYQFEDNKLIKGSYSASGKEITDENYNKIKDILNKKYDEFRIITKDNSSGKIMEAKNLRSVVRYFTDFEYYDMKLEYFEINYFNKKNVESSSEDEAAKLF